MSRAEKAKANTGWCSCMVKNVNGRGMTTSVIVHTQKLLAFKSELTEKAFMSHCFLYPKPVRCNGIFRPVSEPRKQKRKLESGVCTQVALTAIQRDRAWSTHHALYRLRMIVRAVHPHWHHGREGGCQRHRLSSVRVRHCKWMLLNARVRHLRLR